MNRQAARLQRSTQQPNVPGLPNVPGILAAMALSPELETHLRGMAQVLLVNDFPGSTLTRGEREVIATWVSARNDCFFCMDSHAAFASELLDRDGVQKSATIVDLVVDGSCQHLSAKLYNLCLVAEAVRQNTQGLQAAQVQFALRNGASNADVQLAVLIAAAFCMFNRCVDGLGAFTPSNAEVHRDRARDIADHGYCKQPQMA